MSTRSPESATTPRLSATTVSLSTSALDPAHSLTDLIDVSHPLAFIRLGQGLIGRGVALVQRFSGAERFASASQWWRAICAGADVSDPLGRPGTGLVALGAFSFSATSTQESTIVIPREVFGRDEQGWWHTRIEFADNPHPADQHLSTSGGEGSQFRDPAVSWSQGALTEDAYLDVVSTAISAMRLGDAHKVVLARDLRGSCSGPIELGGVVQRLADAYPDTHVFAIDGLVGASPETLASVRGRKLRLRVLAGSSARGDNPVTDRERAEALITSAKDLDEHRYAVASVVDSLRARDIPVVADDSPFTIKLPNLWHLATDVVAQLPDQQSVLDAVSALHPTAAVAGSPTAAALELIAALEPFDRGYYAGPVGWIDARGDGDWAIALRCATVSEDGSAVTAYAGAGIVADSNPSAELLETNLKFLPIQQAFS